MPALLLLYVARPRVAVTETSSPLSGIKKCPSIRNPNRSSLSHVT